MDDEKCLNGTGLRAVIDWILSAFTKKKDFDALEIGGRNILRGTKFNTISNISPDVGSGVTCDVVNQEDPSSPSGYSLTITRTDSTTTDGGRYIIMPYKLTNGKVYTWNFYAKGSGTWNIGSEQNGYKVITLTSDYSRYNHTFTANNSSYYQFVFYTHTKNASITICGVKLEVGNKATDWTPAPEDVETAISDVTNDCIKGLSVSDKTITYTKGDGSKGTITTQDTNTWRGIQNNLTSDSTTESLAAAQGKALKALVDGKAASSHKHAKSDITDMPTSLPANGGNADTVDGEHASAFAHCGIDNNLITRSNEFNFVSSQFSGEVYFNYRTTSGKDGNITGYILGNGKGGTLGTIIHSGNIGAQSVNYATSSGNADTVDGKHAADLVQIIDCPDGTDSKICIGISGKTTIYRCAGSTAFTDVPELYTRQGTIIAINFGGDGTAGSNVMWVKQIFVSAHAQTYVRYIDGSGVGSWCRDVIDIVIGTSSAQIAYKTGYTKALIEFWKTLVGTGTTASTCSSTVYDSVLVTDLSSSMTAVNGKSISSGPDFSFAYSISTGGAITPSGNFSKYRITYFN